MRQLILHRHNFYRFNAFPRPKNALAFLTWDPAATETAKNIAFRLASSCGNLEHSDSSERNNCGENLAFLGGSLLTQGRPWERSVNLWGDERDEESWRFGCSSQNTFSDWGHYTQVVAERTMTVGCAAATCSRNGLQSAMFVCHYCPAGNFPPINQPYEPESSVSCR